MRPCGACASVEELGALPAAYKAKDITPSIAWRTPERRGKRKR